MQRVLYLDGLKGICAIIVMLSHFGNIVHLPQAPFINDFYNGKLAVQIFIIVSAFISYSALVNGADYKKVALKRYFRLVLPISVVLWICALLSFLGLFDNLQFGLKIGNDIFCNNTRPWRGFILALFLSPLSEDFGWLYVLWMMKYVFFGTFCAIIIHLLLRNMAFYKKLFFLTLCVLLSNCYDYWFCGIFIGFIFVEFLPYIRKIRRKRIIYVALLAIYCLLTQIMYNNILEERRFCQFCLVKACSILLFVFLSSEMRHFLSTKILLWLGMISMSIYLLHVPILESLGIFLFNIDFNQYALLIILISMTLLLSYAFNKIIESKCVTITNKICSFFEK